MSEEFFQVPYLPQDGRDLLPLEHEKFDTLEEAENFAHEKDALFIYRYDKKFVEAILVTNPPTTKG